MEKKISLILVLALAGFSVACGDDDGHGADTGTDAPMADAPTPDAPNPDAPMADAPMADAPDGFDFRTDMPTAYTRTDRLGMPAVSTALLTDKAGYNADSPVDDVMDVGGLPKWAGEIATNLGGLHQALEDDFTGLGLTTCEDTALDPPENALPCATQLVADPVTVLDLIVPDTISIDTAGAAGFPNGRQLADPVMDVTLAVIFLDLTVHTPTTLAEVPVNPTANDLAFSDAFPYLADPHLP